ncbi:GGDEF domain-containing protein [Methylotenera versatilis]|uniref:GGDEF domain-containing protein n=1 Tax=Methylotenera versatilis TaxID=1055487 RepID=UPI0006461B52|nr:GGDEF domain-containing protein [Methylotenera versatilis]
MMFAWLEFRTMLFMSGLLAVALSILLLTINSRTVMLNGLKEWVYANLLIGGAIITFTQVMVPLDIRTFIGGLLIVSGLALYFISIRIFDQRPIERRYIQSAFLIFIVLKITIAVLSKSEYASVVFNTAICMILTAVIALYLLKYSSQKRSPEYRFTGVFFVIFTGITLWRFYILCADTVSPLAHLTEWTLNEVTFLGCMLSVLAINFGFIAMVNVRLAELLAYSAGHDWLTGVMNRGNLEKGAELLTLKSFKSKQTQAMLLMDLDHFKEVNDTYGHLLGDKVIQTFAQLAKDNMRDIDLLGRYGGEEFCILIPNASEKEALMLAERIRQKYENMPIMLNDQSVNCTVSAGVCDSSQLGSDFKSMFSAADKALYAAKKAGRNKVVLYSSL